MINHTVTVNPTNGSQFVARCICGDSSGFVDTRQLGEDWEIRHHRNVQTARAGRSNRTPSVSDQHKYYASKAEDRNLSREDRAMWQLLADGLRSRLPAVKGEPSDDEALF